MAKEDRTKLDFYMKINIFEFLNHYCYLKDFEDIKPKKI